MNIKLCNPLLGLLVCGPSTAVVHLLALLVHEFLQLLSPLQVLRALAPNALLRPLTMCFIWNIHKTLAFTIIRVKVHTYIYTVYVYNMILNIIGIYGSVRKQDISYYCAQEKRQCLCVCEREREIKCVCSLHLRACKK